MFQINIIFSQKLYRKQSILQLSCEYIMTKKIEQNNNIISFNEDNELQTITTTQDQMILFQNKRKCSKKRGCFCSFASFCVLQVIIIFCTIKLAPQKLKQVTVTKDVKNNLYVNKVQKIIQPTQKLNYNYSQQIQNITVVMTSAGRRYPFLKQSLNSFFVNNTYPIRQIIIIDDDFYNDEFEKLTQIYKNVTWVSTNLKVGQFYAVDLAYKHVQTQYVFHTEEDFMYIRPNFIEECLKVMRKDKKISQVILRHWPQPNGDKQGKINPSLTNFSAFSFNPSVKRMSQYRIFEQKFGGFSQYTKFLSFQKGAGGAQVCISIYLIKQGFYGYRLKDQYVLHIGDNNGLPKYWNGYSNTCSFI